jgi:type VII secretion protein EccE
MSEATGSVRAVARVGSAPPAPPSPVVLLRRRRPGHIGLLSLTQLLLAELLLVGVLAAAGAGWIVMVAAAVVVAAAMSVLFWRRRGRWWTERLALSRGVRRRRGATPSRNPDPRLAALHVVAPGLAVSTYEASDGERVGVARDDSGWFGVAAVMQPQFARSSSFGRLPLDRLAQGLREMGQPGAVVQLVVQSVPAPTNDIDSRNRCVLSYQELLGQHGTVPADRIVWLSVRVDERRYLDAWVNESDPVDQAPAVVAALVRRMGRVMRRDGVNYQALDTDGLLDALVRSLDLERDPAAEPPKEAWESWRSAHLTHASFWVSHWPPADQAAEMLEQLAAVPAAATSLSFTLDAHEDFTDFRCIVRVSTKDYGLDAAASAVREIVHRFGGSVLRLDGEQVPAAYATAPTGGGAQ